MMCGINIRLRGLQIGVQECEKDIARVNFIGQNVKLAQFISGYAKKRAHRSTHNLERRVEERKYGESPSQVTNELIQTCATETIL